MVEIDLSEHHDSMLDELVEMTSEEQVKTDLKNMAEQAIHSSWRQAKAQERAQEQEE